VNFAWPKQLRPGAWLVALGIAALGWCLHEFALGSGLVNLSYDLLHIARKNLPSDEALLVYLDEKSHLELDQPLNAPWDRALHARMVERLTRAGARAVVIDIVFSDPNSTRSEADVALAGAIARNGRVVLGVDHVLVGPKEKQFIPPFEMLRTNAAEIGSVEMTPSRDLIVREHAYNEQIPSMSWAAAKLLGAPVTQQSEAERFHSQPAPGELPRAWVNYYGPPNHLPHVSYAAALDPARVPDAFFSNKVVFIGARILTKLQNERKDEYRNPFSFWLPSKDDVPFIAGVEIQATMFLNLLRGDWLRRLSVQGELLTLVLFGFVAGFTLMRLRPGAAVAVGLLLLVAVAFFSRELFVRKLTWFPWLIAWVQVGVALAFSVAINSIRLYVEKRLLEQSLSIYLSPKLVQKFATNRDRSLLQPGAEKQRLTILFSDIANFTSISEGMDSDELARMMNDYFQSAVSKCIHPTDGTVVKYIGDAIFAFWNAPEPQPNHAARACEAALRFAEHTRGEFRGRKLVTRLGLHTGVANVGNFGSETRVDYTAIGESINLASRMEGLNKYLGTQVLITGDTKKEIGTRFRTRYLGRFRLKGFERAVDVHELLAQSEDASDHGFDDALRLFQQRDLLAAENAFQRVLEALPGDGPTQFYLRHIDAVRGEELPESWAGEVELKEK
jgi:adenylate cyclase